jgi:hypothetical protein
MIAHVGMNIRMYIKIFKLQVTTDIRGYISIINKVKFELLFCILEVNVMDVSRVILARIQNKLTKLPIESGGIISNGGFKVTSIGNSEGCERVISEVVFHTHLNSHPAIPSATDYFIAFGKYFDVDYKITEYVISEKQIWQFRVKNEMIALIKRITLDKFRKIRNCTEIFYAVINEKYILGEINYDVFVAELFRLGIEIKLIE